MSHFAVLVIGPDHETQLAPFHEFECTGTNDEYVVEVDETEELAAELREKGLDYHGYENRVLKVGETPDISGRHQFGYVVMDGDEIVKIVRRTNPNKKWDWYVVGGRWAGYLLLKPGKKGVVVRSRYHETPPVGYCDQALKGDVDFAQMRNDAGAKARLLWRKTREITGGCSWDNWEDTKIRCGVTDESPSSAFQAVRDAYGDQPAITLLRASGNQEYSWQIDDDLSLDEEKFIELKRQSACVLRVFVRDSQWTEKGEMGWWGISHGDMSDAQWSQKFNDMLDALPDDTLLTVVDCHI